MFGLISVIALRLLEQPARFQTLGGVLAGYGVVRGYYLPALAILMPVKPTARREPAWRFRRRRLGSPRRMLHPGEASIERE